MIEQPPKIIYRYVLVHDQREKKMSCGAKMLAIIGVLDFAIAVVWISVEIYLMDKKACI